MSIRKAIKGFMPRSMYGRALLILVTPILMIQLVSTVIFFNRHWDKMTGRLAYAVAGEIAIVVKQLDETQDPDKFSKLSREVESNLNLVISFENRDDNTFEAPRISGNESTVADALTEALAAKLDYPTDVMVDIPHKMVYVTIEMERGILHVTLPQRRLFSSSAYIFLLWMTGTSLALMAIAVLFMRNQIRPIRRLAVAAERFGKGRDIPASFKPEGAREIRQAAQAFIDMHDRIRRQIQQRTAMLAGVSHDLRTPLTRMKLQTAMLPNSQDTEALKSDIADMERMIDAYLDFARGEGSEQTSRIDIRDMLNRLAQNARRQGASVTIDIAEDLNLTLQIRPVAFERALKNIVNNAVKFAAGISITATRSKETMTITIDDDGPGIPEDQYDEVFKPFVRGDPSRNQETGGVGLGLPIARDIIHGHGGDITFSQSTSGGLRATITIPL